MSHVRRARRSPDAPEPDRERLAEVIATRLDGAMAALGIIFLLVVLGGTIVPAHSGWSTLFDIAGWAIWAAFLGEFVARMIVAPSTGRFLRANWWQALFLVVPFLRFVRLFYAFRIARAGRVLSSALRTGRSAASKLRGRLGWLLSLTMIVVLAAAQLLYELAGLSTFGDALHAAAFGAITGEPIASHSVAARVIELALAAYSVVVFASLAGILGAFFLEDRSTDRSPSQQEVDEGS